MKQCLTIFQVADQIHFSKILFLCFELKLIENFDNEDVIFCS